jgi:hypothetical protein
LEIKYFVAVLCALLIFGGLYFKFLYDVPDGEEKTNSLVSWFLVVVGVIGIMIAALWRSKNPLNSYRDNYQNHFLERKGNHQDNSRLSGTFRRDFTRWSGKLKK